MHRCANNETLVLRSNAGSKGGLGVRDFLRWFGVTALLCIGSMALAGCISLPLDSLQADFSASPTQGEAPLTVQFTDETVIETGGTMTPTQVDYKWDFGDGHTSTEQNPVHTYDNEGVYSVRQTIIVSGSTTHPTSDTTFELVSVPSGTVAEKPDEELKRNLQLSEQQLQDLREKKEYIELRNKQLEIINSYSDLFLRDINDILSPKQRQEARDLFNSLFETGRAYLPAFVNLAGNLSDAITNRTSSQRNVGASLKRLPDETEYTTHGYSQNISQDLSKLIFTPTNRTENSRIENFDFHGHFRVPLGNKYSWGNANSATSASAEAGQLFVSSFSNTGGSFANARQKIRFSIPDDDTSVSITAKLRYISGAATTSPVIGPAAGASTEIRWRDVTGGPLQSMVLNPIFGWSDAFDVAVSAVTNLIPGNKIVDLVGLAKSVKGIVDYANLQEELERSNASTFKRTFHYSSLEAGRYQFEVGLYAHTVGVVFGAARAIMFGMVPEITVELHTGSQDVLPATPDPSFPDKITTADLNPEFLWDYSDDNMALFEVELYENNLTIHKNTDIETTNYTIPDGILEHSSSYSWRVRAYNEHGSSSWSEVAVFDTPPEPQPELHRLELQPASPIGVWIGHGIGISATGYDEDDNPVAIDPNWSIEGNIGSVHPKEGDDTTFTASSTGVGTIMVSEEDVTETTEVRVGPIIDALSISSTNAVSGAQVDLVFNVVNPTGDTHNIELGAELRKLGEDGLWMSFDNEGNPTRTVAPTAGGKDLDVWGVVLPSDLEPGIYSVRGYLKHEDGQRIPGEGAEFLIGESLNIQDSPTYTLTITRSGTGYGTVTSSPAGIDCGGTCSAEFDEGASVDLTATAGSGSNFVGWSGACSGTGTCTVTMNGDRHVEADFATATNVSLSVDGGTSSTREQFETFHLSGSGYTPNGTVERFYEIDGSEHQLPETTADSSGDIAWEFTPECWADNHQPGEYQVWTRDQATDVEADPVTVIIETGPGCDPQMRVDGGLSATRNQDGDMPLSFTGSGFTANVDVEREFVDPNGNRIPLPTIESNSQGEISWEFTPSCETVVPGMYSYHLTDTETDIDSNEITVEILSDPGC